MPHKNKEEAKEYFSKYYSDHRELKLAKQRVYYLDNKEAFSKRARKSHLKQTYGLTPDEYLQLVLDQNNVCKICNQQEYRLTKTGDVKPLSIDHCHTTGKVRGLLCNDCNAMLGFAKEENSILENAIKYLNSFKE